MADFTITAANVNMKEGTKTKRVQYGATITAGQALYKDTSDSDKYKLADANNTAATAGADDIVVAMTPGDDGDYGIVATSGLYDMGATITEGAVVVLSATAGGLAPVADLTSGWNTTFIGIGGPTNQIDLQPYASGQTVP